MLENLDSSSSFPSSKAEANYSPKHSDNILQIIEKFLNYSLIFPSPEWFSKISLQLNSKLLSMDRMQTLLLIDKLLKTTLRTLYATELLIQLISAYWAFFSIVS